MKKLSPYAVLVIAAILMLTSCSHFSFEKRRYRSGFYTSLSGSNHRHTSDQDSVTSNMQTVSTNPVLQEEKTNPVKTESPSEVISSSEVVSSDIAEVKITNNPPTTASEQGVSMANTNEENVKIRHSTQKSKLKSTAKKLKATSNEEARSLLWLLFVIILILWLVSFIAGGFGLGGLIHLLLVIVLILFLLWLFRII